MNRPIQSITANTAWPKFQRLFVAALLFAAPLVVAQTSAPKNDGNIKLSLRAFSRPMMLLSSALYNSELDNVWLTPN